MYSHETIYKMSAPFFGEEEKIIIFFLTWIRMVKFSFLCSSIHGICVLFRPVICHCSSDALVARVGKLDFTYSIW